MKLQHVHDDRSSSATRGFACYCTLPLRNANLLEFPHISHLISAKVLFLEMRCGMWHALQISKWLLQHWWTWMPFLWEQAPQQPAFLGSNPKAGNEPVFTHAEGSGHLHSHLDSSAPEWIRHDHYVVYHSSMYDMRRHGGVNHSCFGLLSIPCSCHKDESHKLAFQEFLGTCYWFSFRGPCLESHLLAGWWAASEEDATKVLYLLRRVSLMSPAKSHTMWWLLIKKKKNVRSVQPEELRDDIINPKNWKENEKDETYMIRKVWILWDTTEASWQSQNR